VKEKRGGERTRGDKADEEHPRVPAIENQNGYKEEERQAEVQEKFPPERQNAFVGDVARPEMFHDGDRLRLAGTAECGEDATLGEGDNGLSRIGSDPACRRPNPFPKSADTLRLDNSAASLAINTSYTLTILTLGTLGAGVTDVAGNALQPAAANTITFSTGSISSTNTTPPSVISSTPQAGSQSFPLGIPIKLVYHSNPVTNRQHMTRYASPSI